MLRSDSVLGMLQPADTASIPSCLPEPAANLGKAANACGVLAGSAVPRCAQSPCLGAVVPGSAVQNVLGHLVPTQPVAVVPPLGLPCPHQQPSPPVQPHH